YHSEGSPNMAKKNTQEKSSGSRQGQGNGAPAGAITKMEAVRRALAELGNDAKLLPLQDWIKERLGIDMTTNHIADARSKIVRKEASQGKAPEPSARPRGGRPRKATLTKLEGVRRALADLGPDAKPLAIKD